MADFILPSKLVGERITVTFDFTGEVEWGETIDSQVTTCRVLVGVDAFPENLVFPHSNVIGAIATQMIHAGLPGVIYELKCTAVGSTGRIYQQEATLAVLPTSALAPAVSMTYYSTTIYPIDVIESIHSTNLWANARYVTPPVDFFHSITSVVSGIFRDALHSYTYWPSEGINSSTSLQSGVYKNALIPYNNWPPEGINSGTLCVAGTFKTVVITYLNWPAEGINSSASWRSGALT